MGRVEELARFVLDPRYVFTLVLTMMVGAIFILLIDLYRTSKRARDG